MYYVTEDRIFFHHDHFLKAAKHVGKKVCHLYNAPSLDAHGVLVDADDHFVLQDAAGPAADGAQVIGHEKWSSHNGPQSHLRPGLVHAEAEVARNQLWRSESHNQGRSHQKAYLLHIF